MIPRSPRTLTGQRSQQRDADKDPYDVQDVEITPEKLRAAERLAEAASKVDPAAVAVEKAQLREKYQKLAAELDAEYVRTVESKTVEGGMTTGQVVAVLDDLDEPLGKHLSMHLLAGDARVFESAAKLASVRLQLHQGGVAGRIADPKDFAAKLLKFLKKNGGDDDDEEGEDRQLERWARFGEDYALGILNLPPALSSLRPFFPEETPQEKAKKPQRRGEKVMAEQVELKGLSDPEVIMNREESQAAQIDKIYRCFKEHLRRNNTDRMGYLEFVLHPNSFARSVENIFHVSFLVNDNYVRVIGEKGQLPQLVRVPDEERVAILEAGNRAHVHQQVISINMDVWKTMVEHLNIKEPAIP